MKPITFSVHFIIRNDRIDAKGYVPIYSKIFLNGHIIKITTNQKIFPNDWDLTNGVPKKKCSDFKIINNVIGAFKSRVYQTYSKLVASSIDLNLDNFKAEFFGV